MTTVEPERETPVLRPTPLHLVRGESQTGPEIDTSAPILPAWMTDLGVLRTTVKLATQRRAYVLASFLVQLPELLWMLLLKYPWRGIWRASKRLAQWAYDRDTALLRASHAQVRETPEALKTHSMRKANLRARWWLGGLCLTVVAAPLLTWYAPKVLSAIVAVFVFAFIVKVIKGVGLGELLWASAAAVATYFGLPYLLAMVPQPPWWGLAIPGLLVWGSLGFHGRPLAKSLVKGVDFGAAGIPQKPSPEMIVEALCKIGLPGMTLEKLDRVAAETRIIPPGVATSAHGYVIELELPGGRTAEEVVGKRDKLAGALRRDLACIWPSGNEERHPGYLRLFLSHKPMNRGKQPVWPLAKAQQVDIFEPLPLFTDEEMRWVALTIAGTHTAVGGASGFGKSVWLRHLACTLAFDLRARLVCFDGKRSGDLDHIRKLAHAFHEGAEPEDIDAIIAELHGLVAEYTKRSKFLKSLPMDERSPKVTSVLASKYPGHLSPIVVIVDEIQEYTEFGVTKEDKKIRQEIVGLLTRLSRVGRSAGIFLVMASQKPDASVIPSAIMGNCSIRIAFKVSEQTHNDQILGTSARKNGIDATMFGSRDRGMAWLKGGDAVDAQVVRSWSEMVDLALAVELADKAYELRAAKGMLTGEAAGEARMESPTGPSLLDDVRDVMSNPPVAAMHLGELRDALTLLRPSTWGHLDNEALGGMLREAKVEPRSVWSPARRTSQKGIRLEWLDTPVETDEDPVEDVEDNVVHLTGRHGT
jgi:S-DNA-T family DNA segregation ATPase FtsK/SpoIIIE